MGGVLGVGAQTAGLAAWVAALLAERRTFALRVAWRFAGRPHARRDEVTLTSPVARDMTPAHAGTPATTGSAQIVSSAP